MYCGVNWMIPWRTLENTRLSVDRDMPDLTNLSLEGPSSQEADSAEYLQMKWSGIRSALFFVTEMNETQCIS